MASLSFPAESPDEAPGATTLDKLSTLLAHSGAADAPRSTAGDGWGMTFLRNAEQRKALFTLADTPGAEPRELAELLARTSDCDMRDERGQTPLMRAAQAVNPVALDLLVAHGADVRATDVSATTALHMAVRCPSEARGRRMLATLLKAGADVHAQDASGRTPLYAAATRAAVDALLDRGASIAHSDKGGATPLLHAATHWNPHVVMALLERGASPLATDATGHSVLDKVRARYGLEVDAPLPSEPRALADHIARWEVEPPQRLAGAPRVAAPVLVAAPRKPINSLPSGHKISLVEQPHAYIGHLAHSDLAALSQALGFGDLKPPEEGGVAQCVSIFRTLDAFKEDVQSGFQDYDNEVLKSPGLLSGLSAAEQRELEAAMKVAHMYVAAPRSLRGEFITPCRLKIMFGGTQNLRDLRHDILSGFGRTSSVDRAARRVGELLAKQMNRRDNTVKIDLVAGMSMGGASAQTMLATLQNRVHLDQQPSMLLLDPQLLNNRQAARATRDGPLAMDYRMPRGVAISLDYPKAPHRGLMGIMKGPGGYTYPGLVHLKLGLTDTDGTDGKAPKPSGPPGLGYHANLQAYGAALARFTGTAQAANTSHGQ